MLANKGIKKTSNRGRHFFAGKLLRSQAKEIEEEQLQVVNDYNLFDSGDMAKQLKGHFDVDAQEDGASLTLNHVKYLRFLDIKSVRRKRKSYHLYNRIIFGHLYNQILGGLKYGYTDEVKAEVEQELKEAMNTKDFTFHGK